MKSRFPVVLAAIAMVFAFSFGVQAQTLTTDIVFLKVGYIPVSTTSFDNDDDDKLEGSGFAIQGEYNLNFNNFWIGFGLEYQYINADYKSDSYNYKSHVNQFIQPMVSFKFAAMGGLYVGAGLSGKYLISTEKWDDIEWDKKFDLWANAYLGYYMPIAEAVFLDIEGRFGYNLTNNQFEKYDDNGATSGKIATKSAYDIAFYVGIGYRAAMSNY